MIARTCRFCGTDFAQQRPGGRPAVFCSDDCRRDADRERLRALRAADPERHRRLSRAAARRRRAKEKAERAARPPVMKACVECGAEFEQPQPARRITCSRTCRNRRAKAQRDPETLRAERRAYHARRRDREAAQVAETPAPTREKGSRNER